MEAKEYQIGNLVAFLRGEWEGYAGVVSWPITSEQAGYVLVYSDGRIAGVRASSADVEPTDSSSGGFTQLTYHLIQLSSYLIENAIL